MAVSRRLAEAGWAEDFLARLGGDEFLNYCLSLADGENRAAAVARRILEVLDRPLRIGELDLSVTADRHQRVYPRDGRGLDT